MKPILRLLSNLIIFILGLYLVIANRRTVDLISLGKMILGLILLFSLLYRYNKRYS